MKYIDTGWKQPRSRRRSCTRERRRRLHRRSHIRGSSKSVMKVYWGSWTPCVNDEMRSLTRRLRTWTPQNHRKMTECQKKWPKTTKMTEIKDGVNVALTYINAVRKRRSSAQVLDRADWEDSSAQVRSKWKFSTPGAEGPPSQEA